MSGGWEFPGRPRPVWGFGLQLLVIEGYPVYRETRDAKT